MRIFGLIGYPLTHSFSEKYFSEKFERENITDAVYKPFPIASIEDFPGLIKNTPGLRGLNVTIPYKLGVMQYLDALDDTAKAIQAVNTIKFIEHNDEYTLKGFNTDAHGFMDSIKPYLDNQHHRKALVLGTGGASKAVVYVLEILGIDYLMVSRTPKKSNHIGYEDINQDTLAEFKVIINTSPLGMYPKTDSAPNLPYHALGKDHLLYDLVYNPEETKFMALGKAQGASVCNGLKMLHLQAEKAWEIWNK